MIFLLELIHQEYDLQCECESSAKLNLLCQTVIRKGLITEDYKLTTEGKDILAFLASETAETLVKRKPDHDGFEAWWKAYPGTDTFAHKGKTFNGTRGLRVKKDECKLKFNKIIGEGEYTSDDLIAALEMEILQKKENSIKTATNKMSFMQNSLTYLNQRTFEPFIELIKEGVKIKESNAPVGGVDI